MNCPVCQDTGIIRFDGSQDRSKWLTMPQMLAQCDACPICSAGSLAVKDFKVWREEWSKPL
jgi:hypothetical protein